MLKHIILLSKKNPESLDRLLAQLEEQNITFFRELPEQDLLLNEVLFITDMGTVAQGLLKQQANVLGWLHQENGNDCFGQLPYMVEGLEEVEFSYLEKVYNRFQRIPWQIAKTSRCIIREMKEEDVDALYDIYARKEITRYMEGLYPNREEEREYMRNYIAHAYSFWGFGTWVVEHKQDGKIIGRVGFNLREGYEYPELGFLIAFDYQRKGLAYEVCRKALEVGKEEYGFIRVQAMVKEANIPSRGLCKKLGFMLAGKVQEQGEEYLLYEKSL